MLLPVHTGRQQAGAGVLCSAVALSIFPWPSTLIVMESARVPDLQGLMEDREASVKSQAPTGCHLPWGQRKLACPSVSGRMSKKGFREQPCERELWGSPGERRSLGVDV